MTISHDLYRKPGYWGILKDFVNRAIHGELDLPPWWLRDVGDADFRAAGQEFLQLFIELAKLQPDERVLDIGCGCGRMALPLTGYLSQKGSYYGLDIVEEAIHWCQQHITPRFPHFQFLHSDLYNERYNPTGRYLAKEYGFPFEDHSFDFIFLTSIFTHLLPDDTRNYLGEVARLLDPADGRAFITFFLLNQTQQSLADQGLNAIDFKFGIGPYRMRDSAIPESAIAYQEAYVDDLLSQNGLEMAGPIRYGTWSGRTGGLSYQDILLVRSRVN
jgi:SAM-dependent methyltransferase